jgi:hypothetical protein
MTDSGLSTRTLTPLAAAPLVRGSQHGRSIVVLIGILPL